jgi:hypothetical protein
VPLKKMGSAVVNMKLKKDRLAVGENTAASWRAFGTARWRLAIA